VGLTGRFDFRRKWTGKIVLRVEEEVRSLLVSLWRAQGEEALA
jgi:hypothetical protein